MDIKGKRILVVEDDYCLADELCQELRRHGAVVLGPAPTPYYAMHLVGGRGVDLAILDVMLFGVPVFDFADRLAERGIPFLLATAPGEASIPSRFRNAPGLDKPYDHAGVLKALTDLAAGRPIQTAHAAQPQRVTPEPPHDEESTGRSVMLKSIAVVMRRNAVDRRAENTPPAHRSTSGQSHAVP